MIYKVSYVVAGGGKKYPSSITDQYERPVVGDTVWLGDMPFEITEVKRMLPPSDDFEFLHATLKPMDSAEDQNS